MPTKILSKTRYSKLVRDVRRLIEQGKVRVAEAVGQELARTYWHVGERIVNEGMTERGGYGDAILQDLSDELGIHSTTLRRCILFFNTYNLAPRGKILKWAHYRELLLIKDLPRRKFYEELVEKNGLTRDQLVSAIKAERFEQSRGLKKKKAVLNRPMDPTYIYKAFVERVIDGDTLLLRIDLGFQVFKQQRVRLARIDCAPMDTAEGKKAFRFMRDTLAGVEFVMVKTNKIDLYGRYIGDVFYSFKETDKAKIFQAGTYLNEQIVRKGLARVL